MKGIEASRSTPGKAGAEHLFQTVFCTQVQALGHEAGREGVRGQASGLNGGGCPDG